MEKASHLVFVSRGMERGDVQGRQRLTCRTWWLTEDTEVTEQKLFFNVDWPQRAWIRAWVSREVRRTVRRPPCQSRWEGLGQDGVLGTEMWFRQAGREGGHPRIRWLHVRSDGEQVQF